MKKNKQQKKRVKKYKGKYVTADRLDMSKGGRVKYQKGKKVRDLSDPTGQTFLDPKDVPNMKVGNQEPRNNTPAPSVENRAAPTTFTQAPIESKRPDVVQPQETFIENLDTAANNIDTTFRQAPTTGKGSDQTFIGREGDVRPAMSVKDIEDGRIGDERNEPKDPPNGQATIVRQGFIYAWNGFTYVNTNQRASTDTDTTTDTDTDTTTDTTTDTGTTETLDERTPEQKRLDELAEENKKLQEMVAAYGTTPEVTAQEKLAQEEKGARIISTGRDVQEMAQGIMPETIPTIPDPKKIDRANTEISPEQAAELQMEATKQAQAAKVAAVSPEQVSIIEDVSNAAAPEPFNIATIGAEEVAKVPEDAVVEAASGSVSPEVSETLAKAAGVQAVAPIDAAEVEILPGALQDRVVGTISPEAKAQAAKVAGTTLARVTRAKKQLRNAGLSEEDIAELGSDPEALEVRLTDFTEEQRGIVEGLPEEALVSNQIDSLLTGIEDGEIPPWAGPAVASVEAMLAQRGMSASTVGRDSLLNAIITSALPIAQANAQAIQTSVSQQKSIEATAALKDAEMAQQTALFNSQNVFNMDMAQFSADQQREINNSKFLQTASLQNATMEQQGVMQDAVLMAQRNLAEADQNTKLGIENAKAFLAMDIQNLNNEQQASVLKAQQIQQRLLSNQAAENAALQFNATSENQVNQFMTGLKQQTEQFNATQNNSMAQFNATAKNAAEARRAGRELEANKLDAQLATDIDKFNSAQDFAREEFNTRNETAIAQSNVAWRRQANTADTAALNAVNQQNAQNAFGLTSSAQNFLWQEVRDEADFIFKRWDNDQQRKASLMIAALGNESGTASDTSWSTNLSAVTKLVQGWLD